MLDIWRRHRRKVLTAATIGAGFWLSWHYVKARIAQFSTKYTEDSNIQRNLRRRFERVQRDCYLMLTSLLPSLFDKLTSNDNIEEITSELHKLRSKQPMRQIILSSNGDRINDTANVNGDSDSHTCIEQRHQQCKISLWNELKILSFGRMLAAINCSCLLEILLRTQFNILARAAQEEAIADAALPQQQDKSIRLVDSAVLSQMYSMPKAYCARIQSALFPKASPTSASQTIPKLTPSSSHSTLLSSASGLLYQEELMQDPLINTAHEQISQTFRNIYLSYTWWLLNLGWKEVYEKALDAAQDVLQNVAPTCDVSMADIRLILENLRSKIVDNTRLSMIIPDDDEKILNSLSEEKREFMSDPAFSERMSSVLDETRDFIEALGLKNVLDGLLDSALQHFTDQHLAPLFSKESTTKFANVIAKCTGQIKYIYPLHTESRTTDAVTYLTAIDSSEVIKCYSVAVFASSDRREMQDFLLSLGGHS